MRNDVAHRWIRVPTLSIAALMALSGPAAIGAQRSAVQAPEGREAFKVATVKPTIAPDGSSTAINTSPVPSCSRLAQASPGKLSVSSATLYGLIVLAYGKSCLLLSGGPAWAWSDRFDVEALTPEDSRSYTAVQLENFNAPKLQMMIQTLLADRFQLSLHREMREMPIYNLVVVKDGKIKPSEDQNPPDDVNLPVPARILNREQRCPCLGGFPMSTSRLVRLLQGDPLTGRPVVDKTGLSGLFDIYVEFALDPTSPDPSIFAAIEEQLGLKLESARAPVEILVIDYAEKPSEN